MISREPCAEPLLWCLVFIPHLAPWEKRTPCATCQAVLDRTREPLEVPDDR